MHRSTPCQRQHQTVVPALLLAIVLPVLLLAPAAPVAAAPKPSYRATFTGEHVVGTATGFTLSANALQEQLQGGLGTVTFYGPIAERIFTLTNQGSGSTVTLNVEVFIRASSGGALCAFTFPPGQNLQYVVQVQQGARLSGSLGASAVLEFYNDPFRIATQTQRPPRFTVVGESGGVYFTVGTQKAAP